ncbi:uncharacterized protein BCR38DRAFT_447725 [Pseudomassariella vexata]|uniref:Centrosomin N-terminal motif 1 domain-containing protein n=1 Tax=Pseudomassariella vexata TaxID=1141098 RepID=A0A1Y2DH52_9PEZI|nr:uncharacterized protein BCR38DRAFT_447725 [Pseudomassariella vexata]ORY58589.1 hypothetical protein BCR38DRAFT_447725 [Pseudomassariella vexata]
MSTLHKQNFDLKLELFHRRERQAILEDKMERLEAHNAEMMELQEHLLGELEKRDKAVDEAVAMIARLEERVEELAKEREMVRQVEADGAYLHSRHSPSDPDATATSKAKESPKHQYAEPKTLNRMPSFLSEHREHTENLRNVVLENGGSMFHLRKVSDSSADPSEVNRVVSPSLSVLSESSFTSVYGSKGPGDPMATSLLAQGAVQGAVPELSDDNFVVSLTRGKKQSKGSWTGQQGSAALSQRSLEPSKGGASLSSQLASLNNLLELSSPLQQLEMLERRFSIADDGSRPSTSNQGRNMTRTSSQRPSQTKTKQEKREALRKVLTPSSASRELGTAHVLPPTPDTISTSTLRRFRHSNDTLSNESRLTARDSFLNDGASVASVDGPSRPPVQQQPLHPDRSPSQPASITAFNSRKNILPAIDTNIFADFSHVGHPLPARPRSTEETTISGTQADTWAGDSNSDSDGGGADAHSDDSNINSNFDPWMRERHGSKAKKRSNSPDLFSFPETSGGWETEALFGAIRKNGLMSPVAGLKRDPLDEMAPSVSGMMTPRTAVFMPPAPAQRDGGFLPPNRRSSLHARTGSLSGNVIAPAAGKLRKNPARSDSANGIMGGMRRSNSIDTAAVAMTAAKMQQNQAWPQTGGHEQGAMVGKRTQYPPISGQSQGQGQGQASHSRRFSGLGKGLGLFKRDRSDSDSQSLGVPPSATTGATYAADARQPSVQSHGYNVNMCAGRSVPPPSAMSWALRAPVAFDDNLGSATPPPIMRNRAPARQFDMGVDGHGDVAIPSMPQGQRGGDVSGGDPRTGTGNNNLQTTGRRKWLSGLGRRSSVKNKGT